MSLKTILGIILLLVYGFVVFIVISSLGFVSEQLLSVMPWWHIVLGTLAGSVAVALHYVVKWEMEDKK